MTDQGLPPPGGDDPTRPAADSEQGSEDATLEMPETPGGPGPDDATLIQPPVPPPGVDPTLVAGGVPPPPPPPPDQPPPTETPWWRRGWAIALWVILAALLAFAIARLTADDDEVPPSSTTSTSSTVPTASTEAPGTSAPSSSTTSTTPSTTTSTAPSTTTTTAAPPTTTTQPPPEALFSDGTHEVGVDVAVGTYETGLLPPTEPGEDPACSWQRLSGTGGTDEEVIADVDVDTHGIVEVVEGDAALVTAGCGDWYALIQLAQPMADVPAGTWAVNAHVAPGRYAAPGGDGCTWGRLSAFTGEPDAVIDGDTVAGSVIVDIADGDAGFTSTGCGTWTPVG